jgi:hypothetical protein
MDNTIVPTEVELPEPKRKPGRPAVVTMDKVEQIARLIAKGMTEEQACVRVGVNHSSFRTARHRNEEFETAIKLAQAEFLDESLDVIGKGEKGWQGRAWILERRHNPQFSKQPDTVVNVAQRVDVPAQKDVSQLTDEELNTLLPSAAGSTSSLLIM